MKGYKTRNILIDDYYRHILINNMSKFNHLDKDLILDLEKLRLASRDKNDFKTLINSYKKMRTLIGGKDYFIAGSRIKKRQIPESDFTHLKKCFMSKNEPFAGLELFYNTFGFTILKKLNNIRKGFYKLKHITI